MRTDQALPRIARRVLVVDDAEDAAWALAALVQFDGHTVHVAHNGHQAIQVAERMKPDLIFMDLAMPEMDGFETALRILNQRWAQRIRICALTAHDSSEFRERAKEIGFHHHVAKPASWEVLAPIVRGHLAVPHWSNPDPGVVPD